MKEQFELTVNGTGYFVDGFVQILPSLHPGKPAKPCRILISETKDGEPLIEIAVLQNGAQEIVSAQAMVNLPTGQFLWNNITLVPLQAVTRERLVSAVYTKYFGEIRSQIFEKSSPFSPDVYYSSSRMEARIFEHPLEWLFPSDKGIGRKITALTVQASRLSPDLDSELEEQIISRIRIEKGPPVMEIEKIYVAQAVALCQERDRQETKPASKQALFALLHLDSGETGWFFLTLDAKSKAKEKSGHENTISKRIAAVLKAQRISIYQGNPTPSV